VARAVIEFPGDISTVMPLISRQVKGCSFNPDAYLAAFNLKGHAVIIEAHKIAIYGIENAEAAKNILEWLKDVLDQPSESSGK
jgi:hypothetical protein